VKYLPVFDKTNPKYIDYITGKGGIAERWIKAGASGWRLDVVDELPDVFLDPLCKRVKAANPDALLIGEVWEDPTNKVAYGVRRRYLLGGQLDGTMNYPLRTAILDYLTNSDASSVAVQMQTAVGNTPPPALFTMMNVLGTHDTLRTLTALSSAELPGSRREYEKFKLTDDEYKLGRSRLKIAAALQFTLPGFPCVFYGDEAGLNGGADPFNRMPFPWGKEDTELLNWYKYLGKVRAENADILSVGEFRLLKADGAELKYERVSTCGSLLVSADSEKLKVTIEIQR
jgi:glycosidase